MRNVIIGLVALVIVGAKIMGFGGHRLVGPTEDKVVAVASDDVAMNSAIAKARGRLPIFWSKFQSPGTGEQNFALKIRITDSNGIEHFWCGNIQGNAQKSSCVIDNEPETVKSVRNGQRIDVLNQDISDWMYVKDDKIIGGETIRAILPTLPKEEAEQYRAMLADG